MLTAAWKALLLSLLVLVPTATATATAGDEDRVVVSVDDEDFDVKGPGPLVVRVGGSRGFIGVTLVEITPELREHYGAPREAGVVVSGVEADTPAGRAGIQVGDVITSVEGKRVRWTGDVSRAVREKKAGETVEVEIVRDRAPRKVSVTVEERKPRERTIDFGDLKDDLRHRAFVMKDFDGKNFPVIENLEDLRGMREKVEDLEKRVRELEKRLAK
ncbi:MAG TPA: PDZ domain-containing protein [Thermoanaerobaculia bacterium]|nr:PDZ domain-containing protein [Thermoanaerobaculia bacterium]